MKSSSNKIARLESQLDFYETEFDNLNQILLQCGFPQGIKTLKETAQELINDYPEIKNKKPFEF